MALVTIQVLDGLERGRVFSDVPLPLTIGREDDNIIRLNDERVSRFHAKIQEDGGRVILTDLDSTNGTRVNGHPVQMRVLQIGDQVSIGRCLLLYGSHEQILARAQELAGNQHTSSAGTDEITPPPLLSDPHDSSGDDHSSDPLGSDNLSNPHVTQGDDWCSELFPAGPPDPPEGLRPVQRAQISDILAYLHDQIRITLQSSSEQPQRSATEPPIMRVDWVTWQRLLRLELELSIYLRKISEPDS